MGGDLSSPLCLARQWDTQLALQTKSVRSKCSSAPLVRSAQAKLQLRMCCDSRQSAALGPAGGRTSVRHLTISERPRSKQDTAVDLQKNKLSIYSYSTVFKGENFSIFH